MKEYVQTFESFVSEGYFRNRQKKKASRDAPKWPDDVYDDMWFDLSKIFGPYKGDNWKSWQSNSKFKKWIMKFSKKIGASPGAIIMQIRFGLTGKTDSPSSGHMVTRNRTYANKYKVLSLNRNFTVN